MNTEQPKPNACPLCEMSEGELLRFLDKGYIPFHVYGLICNHHKASMQPHTAILPPNAEPQKPATSELKPCPFCKREDIRITHHVGERCYSVCCYHCGASKPPRKNRQTLMESWNQREAPDYSAMARILADRHAEHCGVNKDDNWKLYGEDFIEDVKAMFGEEN